MKSNKEKIDYIEKLLQDSDEDELCNRLVYAIPKKNLEFIKNSGYKFSKFVNEAIEEKINEIKGKDSGKK